MNRIMLSPMRAQDAESIDREDVPRLIESVRAAQHQIELLTDTKMLEQARLGDELSVDELIDWLRGMAQRLSELKKQSPLEWEERQSLREWLFELPHYL